MTSKTIANCPECGGSLGFADVAIIGENMLVNGYESVAACPRCGVQWEWSSSGEIQRRDDGSKNWWDELKGKPRTKPGHCEFCGKLIEGSKRKLHCNRNCRRRAHYRRTHPVVKRKRRL
jgi:hypothetical protein